MKITIPCKPFVRVFIEQNYGIPVRFNRDKGLMNLIRIALTKNDRRDKHIPINYKVFNSSLSFHISLHDCERYGSFLTYKTVQYLNQLFEDRLKIMMISWCKTQFIYGMKPFDCIKQFQDRFGYPEDVWKFESIYKYCQRNNVFDSEPKNQISSNISKITLASLSAKRTLTFKAKSIYEDN